MSLLVLMYHRARPGPHGNPAAMLDAHFAQIARDHSCVLPGEPLNPAGLNVCLTFDDAYFDFYAIVFPLLKKHGLRALLAVPPTIVTERCELPLETRLREFPEVAPAHSQRGGFCTWGELREMTQTRQVAVAAHGFTHRRLDEDGIDLHAEIVAPKVVLEVRLEQTVDSFVFPYGRFNPEALQLVHENYRHAFRIGGADNPGWDRPILYRVAADAMESPDALFAPARLTTYRVRRFWNQVRGR
jgi:peptidoglycan/xylan/chitin deacetylase (PgdA/CDA1 family)